ncbi:MAG: LysM domain-containing protein [Pseudobdellovibrio sp.]
MNLKLIFLFTIAFSGIVAVAEESTVATTSHAAPVRQPVSRPRNPADLNKESSSFIGDPDSLDVMPTKRENIKEDEEPILEDIRQVLDAPAEKKVKPKKEKKIIEAKKEVSELSAVQAQAIPHPEIQEVKPFVRTEAPMPAPKKIVTQNKKLPKKIKLISKPIVKVPKIKIQAESAPKNLQSDDPDFQLEHKFNQTYKTYNAVPTSDEAWGTVLTNRAAKVYIVQKGDTLWSISKTLFGDPNFWPKIWSLNRMGVVNPHFIVPGLQVVFYSGSEENIPSLAVTKKGAVNPEDETETDTDGKSAESNQESSLSMAGESRAGVIPDSLPLSRNDNYFLPPKILKIELPKDVEVQDVIYTDIFLAGSEMKSQIDISLDEMGKGRCGGNQVLKVNEMASGKNKFRIYEALETLKSDVGNVYAYRYVGEAMAVASNKIKITSCNSVMSDQLVFLTPESVEPYRMTKTSGLPQPQIVGGPNLGTQSLFSNKQQILYLNMGVRNVEIGQSLTIKSQMTDEASGEIKILEKFGSFAIALITEVQDLIEKGDEITSK